MREENAEIISLQQQNGVGPRYYNRNASRLPHDAHARRDSIRRTHSAYDRKKRRGREEGRGEEASARRMNPGYSDGAVERERRIKQGGG